MLKSYQATYLLTTDDLEIIPANILSYGIKIMDSEIIPGNILSYGTDRPRLMPTIPRYPGDLAS